MGVCRRPGRGFAGGLVIYSHQTAHTSARHHTHGKVTVGLWASVSDLGISYDVSMHTGGLCLERIGTNLPRF